MSSSALVWAVWAIFGVAGTLASFAVLEIWAFRFGSKNTLTTLSEIAEAAIARYGVARWGIGAVMAVFWIGLPLLGIHWYTGVL